MNSQFAKRREQSDYSRIQRALRSYKILVDTSFAMQPGFAEFAAQNAVLLRRNPILVSRLVLDELHRLCRGKDTQKQHAAKHALDILNGLISGGYADIRYESSDKYVDLVIQQAIERHLLTHDFVVFTNDVGLMKDLHAKKQKKSVQTSRHLVVAKLNGASQKLEIFAPNKKPSPYSFKSLTATSSTRGFPKPFAATTTLSRSSNNKLSTRTGVKSGDRVHLSDGSAATLGKDLAHGGEGTVFEITGRDEVCKIYHPDKLTSDREQKVRLMLTRKLSDPAICWPSALVLDQDRVFRGYVMSRACGRPLAHGLFVSKSWLQQNPQWNRRHSVRLAINILERIDYLHRLNVLLGDINPLNILVKDEENLFFVDTDSYQIQGYACPVGTPDFTAPEIQGVNFHTFLRTPEHELFAVATLLFMTLMPGKAPYSHQGGESASLNIREMHFPYPLGDNHSDRVPLGPWRFCWSHLSFGIKEAFYQTFHSDYRQEPRVTLRKWLNLLTEYERLLNLRNYTFFGPKRQIGFDLSILPQNLRVVAGQENIPEDNGQTDMQKEFRKLYVSRAKDALSIGRHSTLANKSAVRKPTSTKRRVQRTAHTRPVATRRHTVHKQTVPKKPSRFLRFLKWFF